MDKYPDGCCHKTVVVRCKDCPYPPLMEPPNIDRNERGKQKLLELLKKSDRKKDENL